MGPDKNIMTERKRRSTKAQECAALWHQQDLASILLPPGMKRNCFHFTSGFSINKIQLYMEQARKNKDSTNGALKGFC